MRRIAALVFCAFAVGSGAALAGNPNDTGRPSQDCEELGATTPAPFADPESAFNVVAGSNYADGQLSNQDAVSQYDVACFQTMTNG